MSTLNKRLAKQLLQLVDLVMESRGLAKDQPVGEGVAAPAVPCFLEAPFVVAHIRRGTRAIGRASVALDNARLGPKGAIRHSRCHSVGWGRRASC